MLLGELPVFPRPPRKGSCQTRERQLKSCFWAPCWIMEGGTQDWSPSLLPLCKAYQKGMCDVLECQL